MVQAVLEEHPINFLCSRNACILAAIESKTTVHQAWKGGIFLYCLMLKLGMYICIFRKIAPYEENISTVPVRVRRFAPNLPVPTWNRTLQFLTKAK